MPVYRVQWCEIGDSDWDRGRGLDLALVSGRCKLTLSVSGGY